MRILIKKRALLSALAGAKAAYPNEFICLLTGRKEKEDLVIEDTIIPPGIMVSKNMTSFSDWMMPFIDGLVGTFHSHPGGSPFPSRQDRWLFSQKGGAHFVAGYPYSERSVNCFLGNGQQANFEMIE